MNIRKVLYRLPHYKIYSKLLEVIVPGLRSSTYLYWSIRNLYVSPGAKWLDLGCGHHILGGEKHLFESCEILVGIDYDLNSLKEYKGIFLKVNGDITRLPFRSNSFDIVTANMVVEHLDNPKIQFQEVNRVLKPGGIWIFHTPNALGYMAVMGKLIPNTPKIKLVRLLRGRQEKDVFKTYYRANTRKRISNLAKINGFEIIKIDMAATIPAFLIVPPLLVLELIWIRILTTKLFRPFRTNIVAILRKRQ